MLAGCVWRWGRLALVLWLLCSRYASGYPPEGRQPPALLSLCHPTLQHVAGSWDAAIRDIQAFRTELDTQPRVRSCLLLVAKLENQLGNSTLRALSVAPSCRLALCTARKVEITLLLLFQTLRQRSVPRAIDVHRARTEAQHVYRILRCRSLDPPSYMCCVALATSAAAHAVDGVLRSAEDQYTMVASQCPPRVRDGIALFAATRGDPAVWIALGIARHFRQDIQGAADKYRKALALDPQHAAAHFNLAKCYEAAERLPEAYRAYHSAARVSNGTYTDALYGMEWIRMMMVDLRDERTRLQRITDLVRQDIRQARTPAFTPFHCIARGIDPRITRWVAESYARNARARVDGVHLRLGDVARLQQLHGTSILRIAVLTPGSKYDPVAPSIRDLAASDLFDVRIFVMDEESGLHPSLVGMERAIVHVGHMSDADAAAAIMQSRSSVVFDAAGWTRGARQGILAALESLVPVVGYVGYMGTSGFARRWMVSDAVAAPPEAQAAFSESHIYLPQSLFLPRSDQRAEMAAQNSNTPFAERDRLIKVARAYRAPVDARRVLCNFNALWKVDQGTVMRWRLILQLLPDSVLWLVRFPEGAEEGIRAAMGEMSSRVVFTDWLPRADHWRVKAMLCDLYLDTPQYNSHQTAAEALSFGIPVLASYRTSMASRLCASQVLSAGFPQHVVSEDQYVERAVHLARRGNRADRRAWHGGNRQRWLSELAASLRIVVDLFFHDRFFHVVASREEAQSLHEIKPL